MSKRDLSNGNAAVNGTKRKISTDIDEDDDRDHDDHHFSNNKKSKQTREPRRYTDRSRYKDSAEAEEHGIVLRKYYPPEMTDQRAREYTAGEVERPIETLKKAIADTKAERETIQEGTGRGSDSGAVVHWFKCDLRTIDNHGLYQASQTATKKGVPLIALYLVSPQDFEAHLTSPVRVDFILRTLEVLRSDLAALDIPLYVEVVDKRKVLPERVIQLCKEWGVNDVYCNIEYEVDELRREATLARTCLENGINFTVVPDTCVVEPGDLVSKGSGNQFSVYTPWYRAWCAHVNSHPKLLHEFPSPTKNPAGARTKFNDLFESPIPSAPTRKSLTPEEKARFRNMWPAGEHEAAYRLDKFISQRIKRYSEARNLPADNGTSVISVHLASGTLAARTCVRRARDANSSKSMNAGDSNIQSWISEVAWRDFYKHVLAHWPFVCMNKSFKPEYTNIRWEYNMEHFHAWTRGQTGYPIVDAAMRQLNHTGYMHNRCRMIVASFLSKDLLLDWRMGERYFMEHLIDGDFASNNGGWGFSSSTGVDPQPYFRIFNPLLQSERFDLNGDYIRKWVPELQHLAGGKNGAIHDPHGRGAMDNKAQKKINVKAKSSTDGSTESVAAYPRPIVEHRFARDRALARYKEGLAK